MAERPEPLAEPSDSDSLSPSAPSQGEDGRPPGIGARGAAVFLAVATLVASGLVLDRAVGPKAEAEGSSAGTHSGALSCPHGGRPGWKGWVVVTNPGRRPVRIRLTELGEEGARSVRTFAIGALRQVYREVSADDPADGTEIEFFGGQVGAVAIVHSAGNPGGMAAERCEPAGRRNWFVMDVPTGQDEASHLVVMNPFDEVAEFDVVLRTEKRMVKPGPLSPYVLAPRHSVGISLNDYLLLGPDEDSLVAHVIQRMGRVVVGGLAVSAAGVRAEAGLAAAGARWVLPAAGDAGARRLMVLNRSGSRVDLSIVAHGPHGQRLVSGAEGLSLAADAVRTFEPARLKDAGLLVEDSNGRPVISAVGLTGPRGDSAGLNGSTVAARRWLVMPGLPPTGGRAYLLVQNPGRHPVEVSFRLIGAGATPPRSILPRVVLSGRTMKLALPLQGGRPVSVLVDADGGTIVAAAASYSLGRTAYAATLGMPMK